METIVDAAASALKMTKKIMLLATGLIVFSLGCAMIIGVREWMSTWPETHNLGQIYFWIICIITIISNYSAMLIVLRAFRPAVRCIQNHTQDNLINRVYDVTGLVRSETIGIYRYSYINIFIHFSISSAFSMGIFSLDTPSNPAVPVARVIEFCFSVIILLYATYKANFYLKINPTEITIHSLSTEKISVPDIAKVHYIRDRVGRSTIIIMNNGKKYGFLYTLKNHYQMVDALAACVGKGRWTSSDWWITKHFKEVAARATSHEEADKSKESR